MYGRFLRHGALLLLLFISACGGEAPIGPGQPFPESGAVEVIISTAGADIDPDGYTLRVGADAEFLVGVNDTVQVTDLPVREIVVTVQAVSSNCVVAPSEAQRVAVESGHTSRIGFSITCRSPTVLRVAVKSSAYLSPLTYRVSIDDDQLVQPPRFVDSVTIGGVAEGTRAVTLRGLSNNCSVVGQNPVHVDIRSGLPAAATFVVGCQGQLRDQILFGASLPGDFVRTYAVNASDGDGLVRIASVGAGTVSPDGNTVAGYRTGVHSIPLFDLPTGRRTDLDTPAPASEPGWSPDGQRLVFVMDEDIHVMNVDGSGLVNLTNHPALDRSPAWSPDGSKIAFQSHRDGPIGNGEIYVMNANGTQPLNLTNNLAWDGGPSWAPDGSRIVFASDRDSVTIHRTIYTMDADGSNPTRLTSGTNQTSGFEAEPSWSPDGTRIAYAAGLLGLRSIQPDGSASTELIPFGTFELGPSHPSWSGP